ncbi:MAG: glycosyltransferase [Paracoccaceae bacterium]
MIFATVGTQLPFDRLLAGLNSWAARNPGVPVFAQTGTSRGRFPHLDTVNHLSQPDFATRFSAARLIVSHAGMGTILSAAELGKPLILMPRRLKFDEHRTDHQQDTAAEMARLSNVAVVADGEALHQALDRALAQGFPLARSGAETSSPKLEPLLDVIRDFVWEPSTVQRGLS